MKVRFATEKDIPVYLEYFKLFHQASPIKDSIDLDEDGFVAFLETALYNPNICVFVCTDNDNIIGITAAIIYPMYFNPSALVAQELWWWVHPEARGKGASKLLLNALETWADLKQAKAVFMIALEDENIGKVSNIYNKNNYKGLERIFIKELM